MENNELIAEFMGGTKQIVPKGGLYGYAEGKVLWRNIFNDDGPLTHLEFDNSWDWLMPVVEKIVKLCDEIIGLSTDWYRIYIRPLNLALMRADINKAFEAVVVYIKWYNTQKSATENR